jgi:S-adenosylmethionine:tRNA ribosyltransferase-isomerase
MMVLPRQAGGTSDGAFSDLVDILRPGDCLVLNDTKVIPARLDGRRKETGGSVEVFLLARTGASEWKVLLRPGKHCKAGTDLEFGEGLSGKVVVGLGDGRAMVRFEPESDADTLLSRLGRVPLPPYIKRTPDQQDSQRYQTVYAKHEGAVAAPTAGLHFTREMLLDLESRGVTNCFLTLNVGPGTFEPLRREMLRDNKLDPEEFSVPAETLHVLRETRKRRGRIVAVGTTAARVLETIDLRETRSVSGETSLFIFPPHGFRNMDALITNFHLPGSSLIALVAAFAGLERVMGAYRDAIRLGYRFYSYGDAMLIH